MVAAARQSGQRRGMEAAARWIGTGWPHDAEWGDKLWWGFDFFLLGERSMRQWVEQGVRPSRRHNSSITNMRKHDRVGPM
jgi:hypothetical protein